METESLPIGDEELSIEEAIARIAGALKLIEQAVPEQFSAKENDEIEVHLGAFSVKRSALTYLHEISLPSL